MGKCKHGREVGCRQKGRRRLAGVDSKISHDCFEKACQNLKSSSLQGLIFSLESTFCNVCNGAVGSGRPKGWWKVHRIEE